jgi:DNA-binding transcriptional MerR regulator
VTREAAAILLGTSPRTLAKWEERFGYPVAQRAADGQLLYPDEMVLALRDALDRELSVSAAIVQARTPRPHRRRRHGALPRSRGRFVLRLERRRSAR